MTERVDVAVVGAGFGGLACALELAGRGARVALFEQLRYPGGCASTFTRGGHRFESGATLFSGFGEGMLFDRWIREHRLDVEVEILDPTIELRAPGLRLVTPPDRARFLAQLTSLPGAPVERLHAFFDEQRRVADALWSLFDDPSMLPPLGLRALGRHVGRLSHYLPLARLVGRTLASVLRRHGLDGFEPLRIWLDAVCQITVQAGVREVEAPFALGAMDYAFRGTGHVVGGVGELAWALARRFAALGGQLRTSDGVRTLTREGNVWRVGARRGEVLAERVVANLTPHALRRLLGRSTTALDALARDVERGWGAAMHYLVLDPAKLPRATAFHLELIDDADEAFVKGNHVFVSVSDAREDRGRGKRTATVSTHVPMRELRANADPGGYVAAIQARMSRTIEARAPELHAAIETDLTASPRTFERFTGRDHGYVGGIPRRAGLSAYRRLLPRAYLPGLYLVGDSVFPGQSTLATALGGLRVAEVVAPRALPALPPVSVHST
ncbi:MAG: FAD-dependent oxidoreductase [Sandaracinus sp.]|nr:FAD-dependent oxidoreductase [Sandaracinus sp.]